MFICKDKTLIDTQAVKKGLRKGINENYYLLNREWPYKNVKHRIIAEKYLDDGRGQIKDYKFHCFNGKCRFILVCDNRFSENGITEDFYTSDWKKMDLKRPGTRNSESEMKKPEKLSEMIEIAETLSCNTRFLRVDFYFVNNEIFFGEMTFFPASGLKEFEPKEWDLKLGEYIKLYD